MGLLWHRLTAAAETCRNRYSHAFSDIEHILRRSIPVEQLRSMLAESMEFINVAAPSAADLLDALSSDWPDLEDFLVARCAQRVKADFVVTRDLKGFEKSEVAAITPTEFIEITQEELGISYEEVLCAVREG